MDRKFVVLMIVLMALSYATGALTARPVTFTWDPNPPEELITHYTLYVDGVAAGDTVDEQITVTVPPGKHDITATASNTMFESDHSNKLVVIVPGGPKNVRVKQ